MAEKDPVEKKCCFLAWHLAGFLERANLSSQNEDHRQLQQREKQEIERLTTDIKSNTFFQSISSEAKAKLLKGDWKFNQSWTDMAKTAGFNEKFFRQHYDINRLTSIE